PGVEARGVDELAVVPLRAEQVVAAELDLGGGHADSEPRVHQEDSGSGLTEGQRATDEVAHARSGEPPERQPTHATEGRPRADVRAHDPLRDVRDERAALDLAGALPKGRAREGGAERRGKPRR